MQPSEIFPTDRSSLLGDDAAHRIDLSNGTIGPAMTVPAGLSAAASSKDDVRFPPSPGDARENDVNDDHGHAAMVMGTAAADTLVGTAHNEIFLPGAGDDVIDGGGGFDVVQFSGASTNYRISFGAGGSITVVDDRGGDGTDHLTNVGALHFTDKTVFVLNGDDATIARLYSAAFGREPDDDGLRVQIDAHDHGATSVQLAHNFLQSAEFQARFGQLDDDSFIRELYRNVLGRDGDDNGFRVQHDALEHGLSREQLLLNFADSGENQGRTHGDWLFT